MHVGDYYMCLFSSSLQNFKPVDVAVERGGIHERNSFFTL